MCSNLVGNCLEGSTSSSSMDKGDSNSWTWTRFLRIISSASYHEFLWGLSRVVPKTSFTFFHTIRRHLIIFSSIRSTSFEWSKRSSSWEVTHTSPLYLASTAVMLRLFPNGSHCRVRNTYICMCMTMQICVYIFVFWEMSVAARNSESVSWDRNFHACSLPIGSQ